MFYLAMIDDPQDRDLFEHLYRTYGKSMMSNALKVVRDYHWAEDVVSESFIKVAVHFEKIKRMTEQERKNYLGIIVRNTAIDIYRKRDKMPTEEELSYKTDATYTLEDVFFTQNTYDEIRSAIQELKDQHRDVLLLRLIYEHSAAETAKLLGISAGTVDVRFHRAKKELVKILEKKGVRAS